MDRRRKERIHIAVVVLFFLTAALFVTIKVVSMAQEGQGPVISFEEDEIEVKTSVKTKELLEGVTAKDERGNDVSDTVMIESFSKLLDGHKRIVNYIAYDANNNIGKASRTLIYKDYHSPKIKLNRSSEIYTENRTENILDFIQIEDQVDGDISKKAQLIQTEYINDERRNYTIGVTNSCGDMVETEIPVTIHVMENPDALPFVKLDEYVLYIDRGEDFDAWDHVEGLTAGKSIYQIDGKKAPIDERDYNYIENVKIPKADIKISGSVDTDKKGTYKVTYRATYNGETANTAMLVVVE